MTRLSVSTRLIIAEDSIKELQRQNDMITESLNIVADSMEVLCDRFDNLGKIVAVIGPVQNLFQRNGN